MTSDEVNVTLFRELFVSRADVYAQHRTTENGVEYRPRFHPLSDEILQSHLDGLFSVGCYLVQPTTNLARATVLDLDQDDQALVGMLIFRLLNLGIPGEAICAERTGGRGWHIWILYDDWVPASRAINLGRSVVNDEKVEIFPKSANLSSDGLGTLVRLPLGFHPRSGSPSYLYNYRLEELGGLEELVPLPAIKVPQGAPEAEKQKLRTSGRGCPCIQALEQGVDEHDPGRDLALYTLALYYRDLGTTIEVARAILYDVNARNRPPLEDDLVELKLQSAYTHTAKIGCLNPTLQKFCRPADCRFRGRMAVAQQESKSWDATALMDENLPPINWVVEGMLPQGFGLLAGKPKLGKSWMLLDLAIAVASGQPFFGHKTKQSPVLFLALEDGEARIQERLRRLECPRGIPLRFEFNFPRFGNDAEGALSLEMILSAGHSCGQPYGLVAIDSFSAAKNTKSEELSPEDMEEIVRPLQLLGNTFACLLLASHHHRKSTTGDVIWDSRGSGAIVAVADVAMGIYQENDVYKFMTRGRDAADLTYWLTFDAGKWNLQGTEEETGSNEAQRHVVSLISAFGAVTVKQVAVSRNISEQAARGILKRMTERGLLFMEKRGQEQHWFSSSHALDTLNTLDFGG